MTRECARSKRHDAIAFCPSAITGPFQKDRAIDKFSASAVRRRLTLLEDVLRQVSTESWRNLPTNRLCRLLTALSHEREVCHGTSCRWALGGPLV